MKRVAIAVTVVLGMLSTGVSNAAETEPAGLDRWAFVIGDWKLEEKRYDFDSKLMQTNAGRATFSRVMNGQRIQELHTLEHGDDVMTVLQLFVYDPRSEEIEIARTDSGHYGFWVIIGSMTDERMTLLEKHPDPESDITRRITYTRVDDDHFNRQLEFSEDKGESWFVRSEWSYVRE